MITQEYVKEVLDYNTATGIFVWKKRDITHFKTKRAFTNWNNRYAGEVAGTKKPDSGYVIISINKQMFRAHRLAWLYVYGENPKNQIDHINGVRDDNRLENLRDTQQGENHKNKRLLCSNKTGYHGITIHKNGRYRVHAWKQNVQQHLGYYKNIEDAVDARKKFELENGYHRNHGI